MGTYVNPGNAAFNEINDDDFIDKTMLIDLINNSIKTKSKLTCISRPRRFGKTFAAKMLVAYYDCSCKSGPLFDDKKISGTKLYKEHLNKHNVIYLEMSEFVSKAQDDKRPLSDVPAMVKAALKNDLAACGMLESEDEDVNDALIRIACQPESGAFVFVIDEWDSVIREAKNDVDAQMVYLGLLREWFKTGTFTPKVVAAAYMTGILPVKKDGSQSPLSDFWEYSILEPEEYAPYFGFNEEEVKGICDKYGMDFEKTRQWYDGYAIGSLRSMYNPYSVMKTALDPKHRYTSRWKKTSAAETLMSYIDIDMDGLQEMIALLMTGESAEVDTDSFENDMETFADRNDVLTLLIHLGYLTFAFDDEGEEPGIGFAWIPNKEVESEFTKILRKAKHRRLAELVRRSDQLLEDVLAGNEPAVASAIHDVHDSHYAPTFYNDDQSLRSVVRLACLSWVDHYGKIEELPSGHGVADIAFFPRRRSPYPGIVVELKWDKSGEGAITQIKDRNYQKVLNDLVGEVILVGIDYDSKDKTHTCRIERIRK